jgi:hypothetical protein
VSAGAGADAVGAAGGTVLAGVVPGEYVPAFAAGEPYVLAAAAGEPYVVG